MSRWAAVTGHWGSCYVGGGGDAAAYWYAGHVDPTGGSVGSQVLREISVDDFSIIRSANPFTRWAGVGGSSAVIWGSEHVSTGWWNPAQYWFVERSIVDFSIVRASQHPYEEHGQLDGDASTLFCISSVVVDNSRYLWELSVTDFSIIKSVLPTFRATSVGGGSDITLVCSYADYTYTLYELDSWFSIVREEHPFPAWSGDPFRPSGERSRIWAWIYRYNVTSRLCELGPVPAIDLCDVYHSYIITSARELQAMICDPYGSYVIANDIYADEAALFEWLDGANGTYYGWIPIGGHGDYWYSGVRWSGELDGAGHTVYNLSIGTSARPKAVGGLFGTFGGTVRNFTLKDVTIKSSSPIAHRVETGTITNVHVIDCNVTGYSGFVYHIAGSTSTAPLIENCSTSGVVSSSYAAGFVYSNYFCTFRKCVSLCNVSGSVDAAGFVLSNNGGRFYDSYSKGSITVSSGRVSGFCRNSYYYMGWYDYIRRCYSACFLTGPDKSGFIDNCSDAARITQCFWDSFLAGTVTSAAGTPKSTDEMKDIETFSSVWSITGAQTDYNDGYPFLSWELGFGSPTWRIFGVVKGGSGLFIRGDEIQAVLSGKHYRSPDFGQNWYLSTGLPLDIAAGGFSTEDSKLSFVGGNKLIYIFDSGSESYKYKEGAVIDSNTTSVDSDVNSKISVVGTSQKLYKTLDYGETTHIWLNEPVTDVSIGGSYVINPISYFYPIDDAELRATGAVYEDVWNATTSTVIQGNAAFIGQLLEDGTYTVSRFAMVFDTTSLTHQPIETAYIRLYVTSVKLGEFDNIIVRGSPSNPSLPIVSSDYDRTLYPYDGGSISSKLVELNRYIHIPLNATGKKYIVPGGYSRLVVLTKWDTQGQAPTDNERILVSQSEVDEHKRPRLLIIQKV